MGGLVAGFRGAARAGVEAAACAARQAVYVTRESTVAQAALRQTLNAKMVLKEDVTHTFRHLRSELKDLNSDLWKATREALHTDGVSAAAREMSGEVIGESVSQLAERVATRVARSILHTASKSDKSLLRKVARSTEQAIESKMAKKLLEAVKNEVKGEIKDWAKDQVMDAFDTLVSEMNSPAAHEDIAGDAGLEDGEGFEEELEEELQGGGEERSAPAQDHDSVSSPSSPGSAAPSSKLALSAAPSEEPKLFEIRPLESRFLGQVGFKTSLDQVAREALRSGDLAAYAPLIAGSMFSFSSVLYTNLIAQSLRARDGEVASSEQDPASTGTAAVGDEGSQEVLEENLEETSEEEKSETSTKSGPDLSSALYNACLIARLVKSETLDSLTPGMNLPKLVSQVRLA